MINKKCQSFLVGIARYLNEEIRIMNPYIFIFLFLLTTVLSGAEYFIDMSRSEVGNGTRENPFSQFRRAAAKAKPGDTIYLVHDGKPVFQNGNLVIVNLEGTEEKPITIDGQMIIMIGTKRVTEPEWEREEGNIWSKKLKTDDMRFFMIFDGKLERMGRLSKWNRKPLRDKGSLKAFEWTIQNGVVSFRLPLGKTPVDIRVEYPVGWNGVSLAGKTTRNLVIKNIIARNFLNDGFNIHQTCVGIHFENIAALECGDDGFSAHSDSVVSAKNFVSWRNSVGICHVEKAKSYQENILLSGNASRDILCLNPENTFHNLVIYGKAPGGVDKKNCIFENSWINTRESMEKQKVVVESLKKVFGNRLPADVWNR